MSRFRRFYGCPTLLLALLTTAVACNERTRTVLREPLASPIKVLAIKGRDLLLETDETITLAGVRVPRPGLYDEIAEDFLWLLAGNGVEIERQAAGGRCWVRCEVRVHHTCGNDEVVAHHEQHSANELLIASGYGEFDDDPDLTVDDRLRLLAAERFVQYGSAEALSEGFRRPLEPLRFDLERGIPAGRMCFLQESVEEILRALRADAKAGATLPPK